MKIISILLITLLIAACGHTNDLGNYVLRGKKAFYETKISPEAATIDVVLFSEQEQKKDKSDLLRILDLGSEVIIEEKANSLKNYVDTEHLVNSITYKLEDALITFIDMQTVDRIVDGPHFIVEVTLHNVTLFVDEINSSVSVHATARIIDRESGGIAWENWETHIIPVDENYFSLTKTKNASEEKILTAIKLLSLSKEEITDFVVKTADLVGESLADTFREDYNKSIKNKVYKLKKSGD